MPGEGRRAGEEEAGKRRSYGGLKGRNGRMLTDKKVAEQGWQRRRSSVEERKGG